MWQVLCACILADEAREFYGSGKYIGARLAVVGIVTVCVAKIIAKCAWNILKEALFSS